MHGFHQWVQDQRPSVLLDRVILGPRVSPFLTIPLLDGELWIRTSILFEYPFFIREEPGDSGDPKSFRAWGGDLKIVQAITHRWGIQGHAEYLNRAMDFQGLATRGAGTQSGETRDVFMRFGLAVRYALDLTDE
jgi:hypothetical protein